MGFAAAPSLSLQLETAGAPEDVQGQPDPRTAPVPSLALEGAPGRTVEDKGARRVLGTDALCRLGGWGGAELLPGTLLLPAQRHSVTSPGYTADASLRESSPRGARGGQREAPSLYIRTVHVRHLLSGANGCFSEIMTGWPCEAQAPSSGTPRRPPPSAWCQTPLSTDPLTMVGCAQPCPTRPWSWGEFFVSQSLRPVREDGPDPHRVPGAPGSPPWTRKEWICSSASLALRARARHLPSPRTCAPWTFTEGASSLPYQPKEEQPGPGTSPSQPGRLAPAGAEGRREPGRSVGSLIEPSRRLESFICSGARQG